MSFKLDWYREKLHKKAKREFSGYPVATVAYYGPNNELATKVSVGIIRAEGDEVSLLERWKLEGMDVRKNIEILKQVLEFISNNGAKTVVMTAGIIGCPHEEGIDYPDGEHCPTCTYWIGRDRFSGNVIH